MDAAEIIKEALADGLVVSLASDGGLDFEGQEQVADKWLPMIRQHKAELVALLGAGPPVPAAAARPIRRHRAASPGRMVQKATAGGVSAAGWCFC